MNTMALILNTNALGGAERSIIEQMAPLGMSDRLTVFMPRLNSSSDKLNDFILKNLNCCIKQFEVPVGFYSLSRQHSFWHFFRAVLSLISAPMMVWKMKRLHSYDSIYANGNKAAIWCLFCLFMTGYKGRVFWHFRDYPKLNSLIVSGINFVKRFSSFKLHFAANSQSVASLVTNVLLDEVQVIYNPIKISSFVKAPTRHHRIGVVAMLAPWKGIHEIILFAHLYEKELRGLGFKEVGIYTSDIYQTQGQHQNYIEELGELSRKFPSTLVKMHFDKNPSEIFNELDILIHSSSRPEPFGRVIAEAFGYSVPVISTALGGAGELVKDQVNGLVYQKYDYTGLFENIKKIATDSALTQKLVAEGLKTFNQMNQSGLDAMEHFVGVAA